ncbi:MAG: hypothetical protein DMF40_14655 [Verrucomicrobia bacterium]|nr:MAG: hypothetical protein DMF40_14655 [Verrucomicrobiota bacterium]
MFILPRDQIPQTSKELAQAIEEGVRTFASRPQHMVTVRAGDASTLDSIAVDLSGATIDHHHRPPPLDREGASPALLVRHIDIAGEPIKLLGSDFSFQFEASNAEMYQKPQVDGKLLLILHRAQDGNVRFEISRAASKLAEKQGIGVDNAQLELTQHGPRAVDGKLTVSAHKLIFHPVLSLAGTLSVSEDFVATVSNLKCHGEGPSASLACAAINPAFSRIEQRAFPLSALPLGEIQLRDLALDVGHEKLIVQARFGSL